MKPIVHRFQVNGLLLLTLALLSAGCVTPQPNGLPASSESVAPLAVQLPFMVTSATVVQNSSPNGGPIDITPERPSVRIEAAWTCETPTCALNMALRSPEGEVHELTSGSGQASMPTMELTPGQWNIAMFGKDPAVRAKGEIRVVMAAERSQIK